jgi:hypothetical protein
MHGIMLSLCSFFKHYVHACILDRQNTGGPYELHVGGDMPFKVHGLHTCIIHNQTTRQQAFQAANIPSEESILE